MATTKAKTKDEGKQRGFWIEGKGDSKGRKPSMGPVQLSIGIPGARPRRRAAGVGGRPKRPLMADYNIKAGGQPRICSHLLRANSFDKQRKGG